MNAVEAMEWAADYAERNKVFAPPMNERGYPRDGHKYPSPTERVQMLRDLAASVTDPPLSPEVAQQVRSILKSCVEDLNMAKNIDPLNYHPQVVSEVHKRIAKILEIIP